MPVIITSWIGSPWGLRPFFDVATAPIDLLEVGTTGYYHDSCRGHLAAFSSSKQRIHFQSSGPMNACLPMPRQAFWIPSGLSIPVRFYGRGRAPENQVFGPEARDTLRVFPRHQKVCLRPTEGQSPCA